MQLGTIRIQGIIATMGIDKPLTALIFRFSAEKGVIVEAAREPPATASTRRPLTHLP
jgi:hypothetical protein